MIATGRGAFFLLPWVFRALVAGQRADHDVDAATDEFRGKVGMAEGIQLRDKFLDHLKPNVGVRHLPPAKAQGHFHFHVLAQKINRVADLDAEVTELSKLTNEIVELATDRHDATIPAELDLARLAERVARRARRRW